MERVRLGILPGNWGHMGALTTTVSQDFSLTSHLKDGVSYSTVSRYCTGVAGFIRTRGKTGPYWPTNTTSSSNLAFSGGLPSKY